MPVHLPRIGQIAPAFTLPSSEGGLFSIKDVLGRPSVLFFYQYNTIPTSAMALRGFRDSYSDLADLDATVIAITLSDIANCRQFIRQQNIPFAILSDIGHMVAESYGVWDNRQTYGQSHWSVRETAFVIDREVRIKKIYQQLKPEDYARSCLSYIQDEID